MDQPGTSAASTMPSVFETVENIFVGPQTTMLFNRILRKIEEEKNSTSDIPRTSPIDRTARYTGIHKAKVEEMLTSGKPLEVQHKVVDRQVVHQALISMYLNKKTIPTATQLFDTLYTILPSYATIDNFKEMLIKMGYIFYKFPNQKAFRVMEKRSVTFERYKYLKSIQNYRSDNLPIIYIGIVTVMNNEASEIKTNKIINKNAQKFFFTTTENKIDYIYSTYSIIPSQLGYWLSDLVSHDVPEGTVFVINDVKLCRETSEKIPNLYSSKLAMVNWLDDHDITSNIESPKAELLNLIEKLTDTQEGSFELDYLIKPHNHKVLRLPQCIHGLSIPSLLLNHITEHNFLNTMTFQAALQKFSKEQLKNFSNQVQQMELKYLEEDMKVDNILDELIRITKSVKIFNDDQIEDDIEIPMFSDLD